MLDHSELTRLLSYSPETGEFHWKVTRGGIRAGRRAGATIRNGYVQISVNNVAYLSHRLAWFYVTKKWPAHEIDHINGNGADSRFCNLREATRTQNVRNRAVSKNNTTGVTGVRWAKRDKVWIAQIKVNRKCRHIGTYTDKNEAIAARAAAERELFGEFSRQHSVSKQQRR